MFRSKILIDRRRKRRDESDSHDGHSTVTKDKITKIQTIDGNNNNNNNVSSTNNDVSYRQQISISRLRMNNNSNFDFIESCDIADELNNEVDSLDSLEIKNWRYHLTNNRF
ncbi:hypothetical protein ACKWTF_013412 [Chironomus riparius]